ncbi:MAG: hypothetical protein JNM69_29040 [Archangium sp.]|nr:hypothetical protein [Archangium sp.]
MKRSSAMLLAAVFLFAAVTFVVRAQLRKRQLLEHRADLDPDTMAAKFHTGERPCLRYPPEAKETPAAYAASAKRLDDAGVEADQLADVLGHFLTVHREREARSHSLGSVDEYLAQLESQQTDPLGKLTFWVQKELLRAKLEKIVNGAASTLEDHERRGVLMWKSLSAEQRTAFDELEATVPLHLEVSGLVRVLEQLKPLTTRRRAKALMALVVEKKKARPEFPVRLEDLGVPEPSTVDAWSQSFVVKAVGDTVEVRSPGADDVTDSDDIVERTVIEGAAFTEPRPAPCGALGGTLVVRRSDFGDHLDPMKHLMPELVGGVMRGFKVLEVKPGSPPDKAGLCTNDLLRSANGFSFEDPSATLDAYAKLRAANRIVLAVERGGVEGSITLDVRD